MAVINITTATTSSGIVGGFCHPSQINLIEFFDFQIWTKELRSPANMAIPMVRRVKDHNPAEKINTPKRPTPPTQAHTYRLHKESFCGRIGRRKTPNPKVEIATTSVENIALTHSEVIL
jgi:hypothetical protein